MTKVTITLDENDLMALQEVILDEDPQAALEFVKNSVCAKIPGRGTAKCDSSRLNPYLWKRKSEEQ